MIDLRDLREHPEKYSEGARLKGVAVDVSRLVTLDSERRALMTQVEDARAQQNRLAKETGPQIGRLSGQLKKAQGESRAALETEIEELKAAPAALKSQVQHLEERLASTQAEFDALLLAVPLPPDADVPHGASAEDNVELSRWNPEGFDPRRAFAEQRGFKPRSHIDFMLERGWVDFERGVKIAGTRSYVLRGDGFLLHQAVLRFALDRMVQQHGFTPMSAPALVHEQSLVGTGFFPAGREQTYHIEETKRGGGYDMYLAGTGEVALMSYRAQEILDSAELPLKIVTQSPCYRREAGSAGKDTAGLYRIHQFEKVEQVVICRADEGESRRWHKEMISYVEDLLRALELPHRLLQCCTGDLGVKNADMIDIECWMPSRGEDGADGVPTGAYGETHSASRLYDYQCRRLNMRYRDGGEQGKGQTTFCHSLNNTVAASPRILIPIVEMHQTQDGRLRVPEALKPYLGGRDVL